MNNKHRKTLRAIFATPPPAGLLWADIEALFLAVGATLREGNGSRVKFDYQGKVIAFHRPHNPKTARAYQIALAREFFEKIGVKP
ncbi:type II toxin-antitoxin system HicA family toxin [uncultured Desulfovibrio sp.]|uniref:type II toxin-antitoxin system HicA family toxin n=1 Tax=uncultured Desulfovibrio sp. TaxID=167968 RepID=UPI0026143351|nr:type II toxin-antitoxin system HicA family toxin [uncultured Desulfovibrio sp.]